MVNIVIYLKKEINAIELVKHLLEEKLIASATIDENNVSYKLEDNNFSTVTKNVITAQSKALLFSEIAKAVETKIGFETPIYSIPIISSNTVFKSNIKSNTITI